MKIKLETIPTVPGVYHFKDDENRVIYVGKAKNLRRRLSQYQNAKRRKAHAKMRKIMSEATQLHFETCENELLALILENAHIQSFRPKWNVVGAFFYLYPMIGLCLRDEHLFLCYTNQPELFPHFQFHGAYRSRHYCREAFFTLIELLRLIGHAANKKQISQSGVQPQAVKHTYVYGFRQIPESWSQKLDAYFRGDDLSVMGELALLLLEKPSALSRRKEMQDSLHVLKRWFRHEMQPLKKAREFCNFSAYPVPQKERDTLFIRFKRRA